MELGWHSANLCSVQCAVCSVQYAVRSVKCAVFSVRCDTCSVKCRVQWTLYSAGCSWVCSVHCAVYTVHHSHGSRKSPAANQQSPTLWRWLWYAWCHSRAPSFWWTCRPYSLCLPCPPSPMCPACPPSPSAYSLPQIKIYIFFLDLTIAQKGPKPRKFND